MSGLKTLLFCCLTVLCLCAAPASASVKLNVGVYDFSPLIHTESDGTPRGVFADILLDCGRVHGWEFTFVPGSWDQCLKRLETGRIDLLVAIVRTAERDAVFSFSRETVLASWGQVYTRGGLRIQNVLDLADRTIAGATGDYYFSELKQLLKKFNVKCRFVEVTDSRDIFRLLETGEADAGVSERLNGLENEKRYQVSRSPIIFTPEPLIFATPRGKHTDILDAIDRYLAAAKSDQGSAYHRSLQKWMGEDSRAGLPDWVKWGGGILALALILFICFTILLRIQVAKKSGQALESEARFKTLYRESQRREQLYESLIRSTPDAVVIYNMNGEATYVNPAFTETFGFELGEIRGNRIPFVPEDEKERTLAGIRRVLAQEPVSGFETRRLTRDGRLLDVLLSSSAYKDPDGKPAGIVVLLRDVTQIRQTEKKLLQSQKMESIGTLAGGIAHEFNNILSIMIGHTELIMDDLPADSEAMEFGGEIRAAGLRARDVVTQLLSFARQDDSVQEPLDMAEVIRESLKLIRSSIPASIDIIHDIPAAAVPVFGNATQISQILINLCTNSADAVAESGGRITIRLDKSATHDGRPVRLVVRDNGCGMDKPTLDRIFEPYFTTKEFGKGTGIGLAVVHGIVERHGGEISADSTPGQGTRFTIRLPAHQGSLQAAASAPESLPRGTGHILYVDDEPVIVKQGRQRLENLGYTVSGTADPIQALDRFRADPPGFDLIITDMAMPGMTGIQLISEILNIRPDIPTILCTGYSERISPEKAREMGIHAFLMKPLDKSELAITIRRILDEARQPAAHPHTATNT